MDLQHSSSVAYARCRYGIPLISMNRSSLFVRAVLGSEFECEFWRALCSFVFGHVLGVVSSQILNVSFFIQLMNAFVSPSNNALFQGL